MGFQLPLCCKCKVREVEVDEEWESDCCAECNDKRIAHANERAEWDHFHNN